jgi:hypothetical protein
MFPVIFPSNGNSQVEGLRARHHCGTVLATRAFLALLRRQPIEAEGTR